MGALEPLVSIVVPAFNAESTLEETLASIARQTWRALEIIVVDDGSTDATASIVSTVCARDKRVFLLQQGNGGVASARNAGIAAAGGDYVAMIDADDLWHPHFIERCMRALLTEQAAVAFAWFRLIDGTSRVIASGRDDAAAGDIMYAMAFVNLVGNGSGLVVRRAALESVGCYSEDLSPLDAHGCEDYLMQLALVHDFTAVTVPSFLVGYRHREGSMSHDVERMMRSFDMAVERFSAASPLIDCRQEFHWHRAYWLRRVATVRLRRGAWTGAAHAWTSAARLDPIAALADAAHGLAVRIGRLIQIATFASRLPQRPLFDALDPADRTSVPSARGLPRLLERARIRRLTGRRYSGQSSCDAIA